MLLILLQCGMFNGATSFNQPLNNWNVSSITDMSSMFNGATSFNQDIISSWATNLSNVTTMNSMFQGATSFDKDIRTWVTKGGILSSGVTFVDMFNNATAMTVIFGTSGTNPDPFYGNTPQVQFFNSPRLDFTFVIPSTETGDEDFRIPLTGSYSGTGTATFSVLTPASAVPTVTSITSNNPETTYKNTTGCYLLLFKSL